MKRLMKRVLLALGVLILLAAAVLGFAVYRANDLIAKFKPQLESALGDAVGASVSLGEIDVSIFPSTELKAAKVLVKETAEDTDGLTLNNLVLSIELTKLLSGKLAVSKLELDSPSVTFVKTSAGSYIEGLPRKTKNSSQSGKHPSTQRSADLEKSEASAISIAANDVAIKNGEFLYRDTTSNREFRASEINLRAALDIENQVIKIPKWNADFQISDALPVTITGKDSELNQKENVVQLGDVILAIASGTVAASGDVDLGHNRGSLDLIAKDVDTLKLLPIAAPFVTDISKLTPLVPYLQLIQGTFDVASKQLALKKTELKFPGGQVLAAGTVDVNKKSGKLTVTAQDFDLGTVPAMLRNQVPILEQYGLKGFASPNLEASFTEGGFDLRGPIELKNVDATIAGARPLHFSGGTGTLRAVVTKNSTSIETKDLGITFNGNPLSVGTTVHQKPTGIEIPFLNVKGFGGTMGVTLNLQSDTSKTFMTTLDLRSLNVSQLLALVDETKSATISGTLQSFRGKLSGSLNPGGPQTWNGNGSFELVQGLVKDVNIPAAVLQKVDTIPFVAGALSANVPERFRPVLSSKDTAIQKLVGAFDLVSGLATVKGLVLDSDHFSLQGDGGYDLRGPVDLNSTILFSKEFSAALVASAKEIRNVLDSNERLAVPLTIKGTPPKLSILPNTAKLIEIGAKGTIRTQAGDALEKTIDKKLGAGAGKDVRKTLENLLNF